MSKYSGKSDLADSLLMHGQYTEEELKNNVRIYVGNSYIPLEIESYKTIIPYYPHLICSSCHDNKNRKAIFHITAESSVDRSEREVLEAYLERVLKIYNRCKKNKTEFNVEETVKQIYWVDWNKKQITEIANRIKENGNKVNIDGIHLQVYDHYRKVLVDEMLRNDLNPADYGYERFITNKEV